VAVDSQKAVPWPLARRVVSGLVCPGGPAMVGRALEGMGLEAADRVVELAPGLGVTTALVLEREPRAWTGVEPDPEAREHLGRAVGGAGRRVVGEPLDATGLEDESASAVIADALMCTLPAEARRAVLAEAVRVLRAGGRLGLLDLTPAGDPRGAWEALADLEAAGIAALTLDAVRAEVEAAGLLVIGSLAGRLRLPQPRDLMREAGPRTALRVTRELALSGTTRGGATAAREALERHSLALRSGLVVAEKPLILGLRRPRR
jgi:SAM-dependent methyltransferase